MSLPTIPNINAKIEIKREEVVNLLLASIALEEIGLSHIINAEGEKIQAALCQKPSIKELLEIDTSVQHTLRNVIKKQMLLQFKLEDVLTLTCPPECEEECEEHCHEE